MSKEQAETTKQGNGLPHETQAQPGIKQTLAISPSLLFATTLVVFLSLWYCEYPLGWSRDRLASDIVDTGYARYLGKRAYPNTVTYLGIPYAEPPLGSRRFRAPLTLNITRVGLEANGKVIDAREYPDFCVQGTRGGKIHWATMNVRRAHQVGVV